MRRTRTDKIIDLMYAPVLNYLATMIDPASYTRRCVKCNSERYDQHNPGCPNEAIDAWLVQNSTEIDKEARCATS